FYKAERDQILKDKEEKEKNRKEKSLNHLMKDLGISEGDKKKKKKPVKKDDVDVISDTSDYEEGENDGLVLHDDDEGIIQRDREYTFVEDRQEGEINDNSDVALQNRYREAMESTAKEASSQTAENIAKFLSIYHIQSQKHLHIPKSIFATAALAGLTSAAYIPSEPWTTLTPDAAAPSGATTDYTQTFGIAVLPIATSSAVAKRDVISQIGDGQIQATTSTADPTTTLAPAAQVISQIGDGQIQATTSTAEPTTTLAPAAQVISQIGDGQIQATTSTADPTTTAQVISQIGDGQIQATTTTSASVISQIGDGQIQASTTAATSEATSTGLHRASSCLTDSSLALTLKGGELTDAKGRIGSIVANRQFQFDGPPPQAGAIYAGGWSVTEDGYLALGNQTTFFQCLSGNFYNLYDESIGSQCTDIKFEVVDLVSC
ncbi:hypothetical protein WICPIJ_002050, partial [Wickerhamomyces pijperi]